MTTRPTGTTIFGVIGALSLAAVLAACSNSAAPPEGNPGHETGGSGARDEGDQALTTDIIGAWVSDEKGHPELVFEDTGDVTGTDGCNGISTTYSVEDGKIVLKEFASTLRACQGVDDWLRAVSEVTIDGDTLQVFNGKGEEIGALERSA